MDKVFAYDCPNGEIFIVVPTGLDRLTLLREDAVTRYVIITPSGEEPTKSYGEHAKILCSPELSSIPDNDGKPVILLETPPAESKLLAGLDDPVLHSSATRIETDSEVYSRVLAKDVPLSFRKTDLGIVAVFAGMEDITGEIVHTPTVRLIDRNDIPEDRYFRDAWSINGEAIAVDMPKARAVHMKCIRQKRNALLDGLDKQEIQALSDKVRVASIRHQKQILRDAPADISAAVAAATTADTLKAILPTAFS